MKAGLKEKIESVGYWRINIRPNSEVREQLRLREIEQAVKNAAVLLRGWDFPSIAPRNDESVGHGLHQDFVEHWCDWLQHVEFWRCYQSTQFLSYRALWEDMAPAGGERPRPDGRLLSVQGAQWHLLEFFEFAHRLNQAGFYQEGAKIIIELHNSAGRRLWISQWNRAPFSYPRENQAETVSISCVLSANDLRENHKAIAREQMMEFFGYFGWDPDPVQIERDQERFYRREFD